MRYNKKNRVEHYIFSRICVMLLLVTTICYITEETLLHSFPKEVMAQRFGGSDYLTYRDFDYGFRLTYPSDWQRTSETGICATRNCDYIVTFSVGPEAVLRVFFLNVGNIPYKTYNSQYYNGVNQQGAEIFGRQETYIGGILPGGNMLYITRTSDTNEPIGIDESWGKYGRLGYLHFKFVAFEPDALTTYAPIAERIINSFRME
jgi:hypothetical protein